MDELDLFVVELEDTPDVLLLFENGVPAMEQPPIGLYRGPSPAKRHKRKQDADAEFVVLL